MGQWLYRLEYYCREARRRRGTLSDDGDRETLNGRRTLNVNNNPEWRGTEEGDNERDEGGEERREDICVFADVCTRARMEQPNFEKG